MLWTTAILCFVIVPTLVIPLTFFIDSKYSGLEFDGLLMFINYLGNLYLRSLFISIVLFVCTITPDSFKLRAIHHYNERLTRYEQQLEVETDEYTIEYLERNRIPKMKELIEYWHSELYTEEDKSDKNN